MTVFSAPDYPQFIQAGDSRYENLGAVAILSAPDYCVPEMRTFSAVLPRPEVGQSTICSVFVQVPTAIPVVPQDTHLMATSMVIQHLVGILNTPYVRFFCMLDFGTHVGQMATRKWLRESFVWKYHPSFVV